MHRFKIFDEKDCLRDGEQDDFFEDLRDSVSRECRLPETIWNIYLPESHPRRNPACSAVDQALGALGIGPEHLEAVPVGFSYVETSDSVVWVAARAIPAGAAMKACLNVSTSSRKRMRNIFVLFFPLATW